MASETYIICKEIANTSAECDLTIIRGICYFRFGTDFWEMQEFLSKCKVTNDIEDIYMAGFEPLLDLIKQLGLKNYLIEYENDFAGMPDATSAFTIPVVNGKIMNKLICDESANDFSDHKRAYKAVGLDYPIY